MTTVYITTFSQVGNGNNIHTVGVFRNLNRAFHALHNFSVFRYPQFFTNMTNFPVNDLVHFAEDFDEDDDLEQLLDLFVDRFIIPFTDGRFRTTWNINIVASSLI